MNCQFLLFTALLFPIAAQAADLKMETVAAWDSYLRTADANLQKRIRPGGKFLWTFENADRAAKVRKGEIVVAPAPGPNPRKVPGGLIHHWIGAVFLPGVTMDEFQEVTRDYDHYKDYYRPSVVESRAIAYHGSEDYFSMVLLNKTLFFKNALQADYHTSRIRVDDCRIYSISRTTRVQGIEDYGQRGEHLIPEGDAASYLWKLYTVTRLQQEPTGVHYELEVMALSRDIPRGMHFLAEPIVRRVSRDSLVTSLQKTEEAVCHSASTSRPAGSPAVAHKLSWLTGIE
jgi:hypothetical protein